MNPIYLGVLSTALPQLNWIYFGLGLLIAIIGAIIIQVLIQESNNNIKKLTILTTLSVIGVAYFYLVCSDLNIFFFASALFLLVQALYYSQRKFKESI